MGTAEITNNSSLIFASKESHNNECEEGLDCQILHKFINTLNEYNQNYMKTVENMDKAKLTTIYDFYLHLMHKHDNDSQCKQIYDGLEDCNVAKCDAFKRNRRNRLNYKPSKD